MEAAVELENAETCLKRNWANTRLHDFEQSVHTP